MRAIAPFLPICIAAMLLGACGSEPQRGQPQRAVPEGQGIVLQLNFKPGEVYEYHSESRMVVVERVLGNEVKTTNDMDIALRFEVGEREAGGTSMDVTYQKLALRVHNLMLHAEYDSDDSARGRLGPFGNVRGLVGKKFGVLVHPNGQVEKITGLDTLLRNLDAENAGDPLSNATASYVQKAVSDTAIRAMLTESFHFYPGRPVRIGDEWSNVHRSVSSIGDLVLHNTYRLTNIKNGVAIIDVDATMVSDSSTKKTGDAAGIMKGVTLDLRGALHGAMSVEVATGMLREGKSRQEMTGSITISGMTVPVTMSTDMSMSGKRLR